MLLSIASLTLCILVAASAAVPDRECGHRCKFSFCEQYSPSKELLTLTISKASDRAFSPAICDKYGRKFIGTIGSTGEAFIVERDGKTKTPISKYHPQGLGQKFSPSFFKSFPLGKKHRSGVGHETSQKNQTDFLDDKCIVLPISAYQILNEFGSVEDNRHPHGYPMVDCVAFRTKVLK